MYNSPGVTFGDEYEMHEKSESEDEYTEEESSEEEDMSHTLAPVHVQRRKKTPSKPPFKRAPSKKKQMGHGLKDLLPVQIVRRKAVRKQCKPKAMEDALTYESEEDVTPTIQNLDAQKLVQNLNDLGKKYCKVKTMQQKMQMVGKASKSELKLFRLVIKNVWEGEHGAFQLAPEEHKKLKCHALIFKEYTKARTTDRRKKEILQEGNILANLTQLMTQLEVEGE